MSIRYLLFAILFICSATNVNAKGIPIIYSNGEEVEKIKELPNSEEFSVQAGNGRWYHADLGVLHEQFSLFWIPLINYGTPKYVLYTDEKIGDYDFTYADLSFSEVQYLKSLYSDISLTPELPFWDAWGGKLLIILIVIGLFYIKSN